MGQWVGGRWVSGRWSVGRWSVDLIKPVYFQCVSHELNLCLSKTRKVPQLLNMITTMHFLGLLHKFSPKSQRKFELSITLKNIGNNVLKSKVEPMFETCWVERRTTFEDLTILYESVIHCLKSIN